MKERKSSCINDKSFPNLLKSPFLRLGLTVPKAPRLGPRLGKETF